MSCEMIMNIEIKERDMFVTLPLYDKDFKPVSLCCYDYSFAKEIKEKGKKLSSGYNYKYAVVNYNYFGVNDDKEEFNKMSVNEEEYAEQNPVYTISYPYIKYLGESGGVYEAKWRNLANQIETMIDIAQCDYLHLDDIRITFVIYC